MSQIMEVKFYRDDECSENILIDSLKIGNYLLGSEEGELINMEFINDNAKSGDYAVRIETDKGYFAVIPNPVMVIGKKSEA